MTWKRRVYSVTAFILIIALITPAYAAPAPSYSKYASASGLRTDLPGHFIDDISITYGITLKDPHGYLSGHNGAAMMKEITICLERFSPVFIKKLAAFYADYHSSFNIVIEKKSEHDLGRTKWDDNLTIFLYYDINPNYSGVSAYVLGHELGHAVHYIIEEQIGLSRSEQDMRELNCGYPYVGEQYYRVWNKSEHGTVFAYDYGMYDYYEDIATIFEILIDAPNETRTRLDHPDNENLKRKVEYIRDMTYRHISNDCYLVFAPLSSPDPVPLMPKYMTAAISSQRLYVDDRIAYAEAYMINDSNYFKLRDIAMFLDGTQKSFDVTYNPVTRAVSLAPGLRYTPAGGELALGAAQTAMALPSKSAVYMRGEKVYITAFMINGNNYFKLRDLCAALDIRVVYNPISSSVYLYTDSSADAA